MFKKVDTTEIIKLANMLKEAHIPFDMHEHLGGIRIAYPKIDNWTCSVIQLDGSYGAEVGKLEILGLCGRKDVEGYLTAEKVFKRIKKDFIKTLDK